MGFYIECPTNKNKTPYLINEYDAELIAFSEVGPLVDDVMSPWAVVCVVENPAFDAAAYIFSQGEYLAFARPDNRMKHWLKMPKELVEELVRFPNAQRHKTTTIKTDAATLQTATAQ